MMLPDCWGVMWWWVLAGETRWQGKAKLLIAWEDPAEGNKHFGSTLDSANTDTNLDTNTDTDTVTDTNTNTDKNTITNTASCCRGQQSSISSIYWCKMKQLHFLNRFSFPQTCDRRSSRLSQYFLLHYCISRRVGGRGGGTIFLFENFPPFHLSRCIYLVTRRLILEKGETISENGAIASRLPLFPILDHHLVNGYTALYKYTNTQIHKYTITKCKIYLTSPWLLYWTTTLSMDTSQCILVQCCWRRCALCLRQGRLSGSLCHSSRGGGGGPPWATKGHHGPPG